MRNIELARGFAKMCTLRDADWLLHPQWFKKAPVFSKIFCQVIVILFLEATFSH